MYDVSKANMICVICIVICVVIFSDGCAQRSEGENDPCDLHTTVRCCVLLTVLFFQWLSVSVFVGERRRCYCVRALG